MIIFGPSVLTENILHTCLCRYFYSVCDCLENVHARITAIKL